MTRPLPPLRLLTVFDAVLRCGGTRQAAAEFNVSQPAVSQSIRQLEDHLGAKLLDRGTRPATLTEAGRILHRATVEGLGRISEAVEEIGQLGAGAEGSVTIACSVGVATYWLMPRLAIFYGSHPDIAINVMTTQHGAPGLATGVDIALRYGDGAWTDGSVQHLFSERVTPVCSPVIADRMARSGTGLEAATLIHTDVDDPSWIGWNEFLRSTGISAGRKRRGLHFTNYVQAAQAALGHQGVMLGWRSITGDLVGEGRLVEIVDAALTPDEAYYLVTARHPRSARTCELIGRWLAEIASQSISERGSSG